eukprot:CAMPEP_0113665702 /NCGR_PEP_ID=MMETSP0038_2-20120614/2451_1 /TAXON_ID=2898 /ORGANISM="Cryptomonas paramecium" /LENGTH=76 /DNA_ID=CAMNT_0000581083 /DNA_START=75 /DNA_END=305 /DNA_ORIENTATION=+ /assembly_acc=CAM_ASM_000170
MAAGVQYSLAPLEAYNGDKWAYQGASEALSEPNTLLSYELCKHLNVPYGTRWGLPMEQKRQQLDTEGCALLDGSTR